MSSEKIVHVVNGDDPYHAAQHVAQGPEEFVGIKPHLLGPNKYRVTVERIEPEPEKRWWECIWSPPQGVSILGPTVFPKYTEITWSIEGELAGIEACVQSVDKPTFAEFTAAVKDATGVEIPEPEEEEPRWWCWDASIRAGSPRPHWREACSRHPQTGGYYTVIYGTTADRDAKRDLLLEAARKAGKP